MPALTGPPANDFTRHRWLNLLHRFCAGSFTKDGTTCLAFSCRKLRRRNMSCLCCSARVKRPSEDSLRNCVIAPYVHVPLDGQPTTWTLRSAAHCVRLRQGLLVRQRNWSAALFSNAERCWLLCFAMRHCRSATADVRLHELFTFSHCQACCNSSQEAICRVSQPHRPQYSSS